MGKEYSLYEAKAKLSELVRQVREGGKSVTITVHGKPAVEIRAIETAPSERTIDEIFEEMERRGEATRVKGARWSGRFKTGKPAPGALIRFLKDR